MINLKQTFSDNSTYFIGVLLICISLGIFMIPEFQSENTLSDTTMGIFMLNYAISILYFILISIREIPKFRWVYFQKKLELGLVHLVLSLISAYSLNREMVVFEESTNWLIYFLVIQSIIILLAPFKEHFPKWLQLVFWFSLGVIFLFFIYLSLYLIPLYGIGILASFVAGISVHALIPLFFVLTILFYLLRNDNRKRIYILSFVTGILTTLVFVVVFVSNWNVTNKIITKATNQTLLENKSDIPEWVSIAEKLPKNSLSEKLLKTGIVYSYAHNFGDWNFFQMPSRNFDEVRKHDPLIMISTFFVGKPNINDEESIHILESMYDSRHKTQERLWSGFNLTTNSVLTNVRLYPSIHIAYTEKFLTIRNEHFKNRWNQSEEAVYTFHLPEGSVVTSLSLWIKGKEEKAVLTSKHKADSAYRTIVGVENRDPSLIRWQEGNTVSVRVFPCTPEEDRRFKIGITSMLRNDNNKLIYENIWFDGPSPINADETCKVYTMDPIENMSLPGYFKNDFANTWNYEGAYLADWKLSFNMVPIKENNFSFDGNSYSISNLEKTYQTFNSEYIYLDINSQWTKEEFNILKNLMQTKKLYAYSNQLVEINESNSDLIFENLSSYNFSVFPVYVIKHPENSILITKGSLNSPNLKDLENSSFFEKLNQFVSQNNRIKLFDIGNQLSPYQKTLRELRIIEYDKGSIDELLKYIQNNQFVKNQEDENTVVLNDAQLKITRTADSTTTNAPDHLMRLFAYNHVMLKTGVNYLIPDFYNQDIVDEAYKAYVVSPVTSLVVLETKNDYERFGIKDDGTSLKNASMHSSGAVPEPHEWALIIVFVSIVAYTIIRKRKLRLKNTQLH